MNKHILVPLDGSSQAELAIPFALSLSTSFGSKLTMLRVADSFPLRASRKIVGLPDSADFYLTQRQAAHATAQAYLDEQKERLDSDMHFVQTHLAEGVPIASTILRSASALGVDLIVMTTHGRSGVSRWLLGSVAEKIVRSATVPVLLVRSQDDDAEIGETT